MLPLFLSVLYTHTHTHIRVYTHRMIQSEGKKRGREWDGAEGGRKERAAT